MKNFDLKQVGERENSILIATSDNSKYYSLILHQNSSDVIISEKLITIKFDNLNMIFRLSEFF